MERGQVQLLSERGPVPMFLIWLVTCRRVRNCAKPNGITSRNQFHFETALPIRGAFFHAIALNGPPPLNKLIREIRGFAYS